jgi:hypothetical protein
MSLWSIGPIRGQFQPESFNETQGTKLEDIEIFGNVPILLHKGWDTREVSLSFVVDGMCDPAEGNETWKRSGPSQAGGGPGPRAADPEAVWEEIQRMQRPIEFGVPKIFAVVIPGWLSDKSEGNRPKQAVISNASINRTHIAGEPSRAVRAIITVTLREARRVIGAGNKPSDRAALAQSGQAQANAQVAKIVGDAKQQLVEG